MRTVDGWLELDVGAKLPSLSPRHEHHIDFACAIRAPSKPSVLENQPVIHLIPTRRLANFPSTESANALFAPTDPRTWRLTKQAAYPQPYHPEITPLSSTA